MGWDLIDEFNEYDYDTEVETLFWVAKGFGTKLLLTRVWGDDTLFVEPICNQCQRKCSKHKNDHLFSGLVDASTVDLLFEFYDWGAGWELAIESATEPHLNQLFGDSYQSILALNALSQFVDALLNGPDYPEVNRETD